MWNLYSINMPLDAVRHLFDVEPDRTDVGNLELLRSIWPKDKAPIFLNDGDRELARAVSVSALRLPLGGARY